MLPPKNSSQNQNEHIDVRSLFSIPEPEVLFFHHPPNPTIEHVKQYSIFIKKLLRKYDCKYIISDTRNLGLLTVEHREILRDSFPWSKDLRHMILVTNNPLFPVNITFILSTSKYDGGTHFVETVEEAITLVQSLKKNISEE